MKTGPSDGNVRRARFPGLGRAVGARKNALGGRARPGLAEQVAGAELCRDEQLLLLHDHDLAAPGRRRVAVQFHRPALRCSCHKAPLRGQIDTARRHQTSAEENYVGPYPSTDPPHRFSRVSRRCGPRGSPPGSRGGAGPHCGTGADGRAPGGGSQSEFRRASSTSTHVVALGQPLWAVVSHGLAPAVTRHFVEQARNPLLNRSCARAGFRWSRGREHAGSPWCAPRDGAESRGSREAHLRRPTGSGTPAPPSTRDRG